MFLGCRKSETSTLCLLDEIVLLGFRKVDEIRIPTADSYLKIFILLGVKLSRLKIVSAEYIAMHSESASRKVGFKKSEKGVNAVVTRNR